MIEINHSKCTVLTEDFLTKPKVIFLRLKNAVLRVCPKSQSDNLILNNQTDYTEFGSDAKLIKFNLTKNIIGKSLDFAKDLTDDRKRKLNKYEVHTDVFNDFSGKYCASPVRRDFKSI